MRQRTPRSAGVPSVPPTARAQHDPRLDPRARLLLGLQRAAGNRAVGLLVQRRVADRTLQRCGPTACECDEAGETQRPRAAAEQVAPVQRALSKDLQVRDKFSDAATHVSQVFFDFASASLDGAEGRKVDAFVASSGAPAVVTAKASEEGGGPVNRDLARRRGEAVAARIGHHGRPPRVEVAVEDAVDVPDYRFLRRVDLAAPTPAADPCVLDPGCNARLEAALGEASKLAKIGKAAAGAPGNRSAVGHAFHSADNTTAATVAGRFQDIDDELAVLAKPGRHVCKTPCTTPTCGGGTRAFLDRVTNTMVGCPDLKDASKSVVETVLHEAVHGPPVLGDDHAYIYEPLFPFLVTAKAFANPDSYVEFTRVVTTRKPTPPRSPSGGFASSFSEDEKRAVDKAVAWAMTRLVKAQQDVDFVYLALTAGHKDLTKAKLVDDVANERRLFKRHFGTTAPPTPPRVEDQWIVQGISNRVTKLLVASGAQPEVVKGSGVLWSDRTKRLRVDSAFLHAAVSDQARSIEWALILDDPQIPPQRQAGYLDVIDGLVGLDVSATEGARSP